MTAAEQFAADARAAMRLAAVWQYELAARLGVAELWAANERLVEAIRDATPPVPWWRRMLGGTR